MSSARDWAERTERRKIEEVSLSSGTVRRRRTGRQYYSRVRTLPRRESRWLFSTFPLPLPRSVYAAGARIYARAAAAVSHIRGPRANVIHSRRENAKHALACHFERRRGETDNNTTHTCCAVVVSRSSANAQLSLVRHRERHTRCRPRDGRKQFSCYVNDPQPGVVRELYPWTAMCVRIVDVHVSCSSHVDAQLAAFFIDPRAK